MSEIVIASRFRGPEESGNGGYACGLVAGFVEGDAEVTLRKPPPLEHPMQIVPVEGGVDLMDGEELVAQGRSFSSEIAVPEAPSFDEASAARERYAGYQRHAFPTCFTCGINRDDGLAIHPGRVRGRELWASPFEPDRSLPSKDGHLVPEIVWSALDCPGAWAVERDARDRPVVLGRMGARLERPVPSDHSYVAAAWPIGADGRKLTSGTALFDTKGARYGWALQTWIVLT